MRRIVNLFFATVPFYEFSIEVLVLSTGPVKVGAHMHIFCS